jgi:type I restriction enzyme, S subunit
MPTKLQKYDKYKPSGLDWLGDIPAGWEVRRIKEIFNNFGSGTTPNTGNSEYYDDQDVNWLNTTDIQNTTIFETKYKVSYKAKKECNLKIFPINSLAIGMYGQGKTRGNVAHIMTPVTSNQNAGIMYSPKNSEVKFMFWWFITSKDQIRNSGNDSTIPNLNKDIVSNFYVSFPPLQIQTAIAKYLDTQTANIDKEIELLTAKVSKYRQLKQTLISEVVKGKIPPTCNPHDKSRPLNKGYTSDGEKIPLREGLQGNLEMKKIPLGEGSSDSLGVMKPSGVEWIGEIPAGWEVKKLKNVFRFTTGATPSTGIDEYYSDVGFNWISISDLDGKFTKESKNKISLEGIQSKNMKLVPTGSLLYSFKLSVGQISFVGLPTYTNEAIFAILPNKKVNLNFWYYALKSYLINNANENIYGAKIFNQGSINNSILIVPPLQIQQQIADYLDEQTGKIDLIITTINSKITKLQEYRKVLINDVVTGRVKIEN